MPGHAEPTRVLFLYTTLTVGGAEHQLALLAPALRARGFEPIIATLRHKGRYFDELRLAGIPIAFVGMRSRTDLVGFARGYRLWRKRPDIVFTSSVDAQVIGQAVALRAGARHVTAEHGGVGIPRSFHRRLLVRLVALFVDRVIAVSASQRAELVGLGYRRGRIVVIPNGIPVPSPTRSRPRVRQELAIGEDDVVALFVATLRPEKRVDRFVEAVLAAHKRAPRLRGVIVGGGPQFDLARSLAREAPGIVRVLGERSDVADLLVASDVVCLTSSFEGLPLSVLEAMALARPVLATRVGGLSEAIDDGRTGWLVAPDAPDVFADELVAIAEMPPEERLAVGAAAQRTYEERYTLERMVERYVELLSALPSTQPSRARSR